MNRLLTSFFKKQIFSSAIISLLAFNSCYSQNNLDRQKGKLIYENAMSNAQEVQAWKMEGPGELKFSDNWMEMYSPGKKWDHVFWCPQNFPESFIAEWQMQNMDTTGGLIIIFFAAKGTNGEDIFESYAQNNTPGAYRVFWFYGPGKKEITVVAITPHP